MKEPGDNANEVQRMIYAASMHEAWRAEHDPEPSRECAARLNSIRDAALDIDYQTERVLCAAGMQLVPTRC